VSLSISSSVNFGYLAASRSAGHTIKFVNIGRNVVPVFNSGRVETDQPYWWLQPCWTCREASQ